MRVIHHRPANGHVTARDSGALVVLFANGTIELPSASEMTKGVYFFMPVGDVKSTIACHGNDRIEGHKDVVISGQKIHGIYSLGDKYIADFEIAPAVSAVEPEAQLVA